jgi:hypothetical protein
MSKRSSVQATYNISSKGAELALANGQRLRLSAT